MMQYNEALTHRQTCGACGYLEGRGSMVNGPFGPHHAKLVCFNCGAFWHWVSKPDSDASKYRRPAAHKKLVAKHSLGYCEMCLKTESELEEQHGLTGHHVIEYQHEGDDSRANVWILCAACHRLVHWVRTYVSHKTNPVAEDSGDVA